ncbi:RNA polymerase III subunit C82 [Tulasnella sp. 330]|nr:RNA polymerase III subunit C82 [Tulasnella sp. 330]KAG8884210.1 RNA polymerase III subunit C82 [Tulasnella sp. 331]
MADKQTSRLCYHVIHSHFGPVAAKVSSTLLLRGRLPLSHLIRLSGVPPKDARHALLILIQHNIVWHSQSDPESEGGGDVNYEINWEEPVARLRFGTYLSILGERLGEVAIEVLQTILDHGKLRVGQVLDSLAFGDKQRIRLIKAAFLSLVTQKYLKPSTAASHHSPRDRLMSYEMECRRERSAGTILTPKELIEIKIEAVTRLQRAEEAIDETALIRKDIIGDSKPGKKRVVETEESVNEEVYFKVNYPKLNTCIRNEIIVKAAQSRFNVQTAEVLRAALKATESKQYNLLDIRSASADLESGLILSRSHSTSSSKTPPTPKIRDYLTLLTNADDDNTATGRAAAFMAGATSGADGQGKVTVEFEVIGTRLKQKAFEGALRDRFGDDAVKVVRILLDKGKLDEKHLAKISLMAPSTLRSLLTKLSTASLISLQEIPRGADRANPKSTIFLWYIDLPKAYANLLSHTYQTLANIVAISEHEQTQVRAILDKRDRSDVNGDERLLGRGEREALRAWEDKRDRLGILAMRVEEMIFVLRDMIG